VWAFVLGPLGRVLVTGIGAQICNPWRPRFVLKLRATWDYVTFGLKASASQILFSLYTNADYWVVGYFYSPTAVGIYRLAFEIVLEPVQDDLERGGRHRVPDLRPAATTATSSSLSSSRSPASTW
jgi:O-antigen/teichoic acid export membrane protein